MVTIVEQSYHLGFPPDAQALILTEIDGIDALLDGQMNQIVEISKKHHAFSVQTSSDPETRAKLWKARKGAFGAIKVLFGGLLAMPFPLRYTGQCCNGHTSAFTKGSLVFVGGNAVSP